MDWESSSEGPYKGQGVAVKISSAADAPEKSSMHVVTRQNAVWVWWHGVHHELMVNFLWDGKEEARLRESGAGELVQLALVRTNVCIKTCKISTVFLKENVPLNFWISINNGSKRKK